MFDRRWWRRGLILAAVGLLAVLGACAGEEATPTATATATTAAPVGELPTETVVAEVTATVEAPDTTVAQIGKYGGTMRWAVKAEWRGTDPIRRTSITEHSFMSPHFSMVVRFDPFKWGDTATNSIIGDLATSWEVEDGGKSYVFHLRDNAYWHDGTPVTCQDVVTSWNHSVSKGGGYRSHFEDFYAGAECRDSLTPVFKLTEARAGTLVTMASGLGGTQVMQHKQLTALGGPGTAKEAKPAEVMGSGPFKFKSADPAAGWEGIRNDNYFLFDSAGNRLPYLDGYISFGITDTGTRNAAYLGNQIDAIQSVTLEPRSAIEILKQKPDHTVITVGWTRWSWSFKKVAPFDDYNVRKAFHLAFDRHANAPISDPSAPGHQWSAVWGFVSPLDGGPTEQELWQMPGWRVDKTEDWAEANRLLDEAGYPRGKNGIRFSIDTFTPVTQEYQDNTVLYASDLLKVGITFKLDLPADNAEEGTRGTACQFQTRGRRGGGGTIDPGGNLPTVIFREGEAAYNCGWRTQEYLSDQWADQSLTLDPVARAKKIHDLELAYYEDKEIGHAHINPHWVSYMVGHWPHVKGGGWDHPWFNRMDHIRVQEVWLDKK